MIVSKRHKKFITEKMNEFQTYDDLRPADRTYRFVDHSKRVAKSMKEFALAIGFDEDWADILYWATLPHDIGKMSFDIELWDYEDEQGISCKPPETIKQERRAHTLRGIEMIKEHFDEECHSDPFLKTMLDIMENHHEHCDGSGYLGKTGDNLSQEVRMACICDALNAPISKIVIYHPQV